MSRSNKTRRGFQVDRNWLSQAVENDPLPGQAVACILIFSVVG
ncbi:MAG: hypothetical protein VKJ04_05370 [Vampirovibrionales bacterium]|nr:hypothetical protein [Vampirovibrionales bacterium]